MFYFIIPGLCILPWNTFLYGWPENANRQHRCKRKPDTCLQNRQRPAHEKNQCWKTECRKKIISTPQVNSSHSYKKHNNCPFGWRSKSCHHTITEHNKPRKARTALQPYSQTLEKCVYTHTNDGNMQPRNCQHVHNARLYIQLLCFLIHFCFIPCQNCTDNACIFLV